ncbi:MAG: MFS transporter, partial [Ktedonobacterales bacterium]|nr:MFS transporter [Ktedonobacterales bacterium]
TSRYILTLFGISVVGLIVFVIGELLLKSPMVDPRLFKNASFSGAAIVAFTLSAGLFSLFFFITLYLQNFLGFSALDAGLRVLPLSGLILFAAPVAGAFTDRIGAKTLMAVGMGILVVAVLLMARISPHDTQGDWIVLLPAFVLGGLGSGLVNPPIANVAVSTVSPDRAGMASGVSGVCRQIGTAFGIALLGAILTNQYNNALRDQISRLSVPDAPAAQQRDILNGIIISLQQAGTFAGSTGLRNPPPQFAQFASSPLFFQIQGIVRSAYIGATLDIFHLAVLLLGVGLLAALLLVKKSDMRHDVPVREGTGFVV